MLRQRQGNNESHGCVVSGVRVRVCIRACVCALASLKQGVGCVLSTVSLSPFAQLVSLSLCVHTCLTPLARETVVMILAGDQETKKAVFRG